jgi:hypothetical protein
VIITHPKFYRVKAVIYGFICLNTGHLKKEKKSAELKKEKCVSTKQLQNTEGLAISTV